MPLENLSRFARQPAYADLLPRRAARPAPSPGPALARSRRSRGDPHISRGARARLREDTRVGHEVFDAVIEYAFGTSDRYLTMVSRDASGGYHIARLSYYDTPEGKGWDRSTLDTTHPTRATPGRVSGGNDRRAGRPGEVPVLPCDQPAYGARFDRPRDRPIAPSAASAATDREATTSSPLRPVSRTRRSSTPRRPPLRR